MHPLVLMMTLALIAGCAPAQSPPAGGRWELTSSGCKVWNDLQYRQGTVTWSGNCKYGLADDEGILVWSYTEDGKPVEARFEGEMKAGDMNGRGTFVWPNGDRYEGEFSKGLMHGYGEYAWANGRRYEGEFSRGRPSSQLAKKSWPENRR